MCGIAGIINHNKRKVKKYEIAKMLNKIKHRGPDGQGIFTKNNIGLWHVLLKIQDTSNLSRQPYIYKNLILTYNGEIYNYKELRRKLIELNYKFDTDGDTEVLIKMLDYYGVEETLKQLEGCYAFSLYNTESNEMYLVRDRFGIKPIYYYNDNEKLVFCSEIKGILECENIPRIFNINKVLESINCRLWLEQKSTLFKDIYCLKPGNYLKISEGNIDVVQYYSLSFTNEYNDPKELIKDFAKEFEESIKKKLISKVPIAAFLSGGLDSSIVCKILNDYTENKLNTYTICYDFDKDLDLNHAKRLADKENFEQHNILITEDMYNIENIDKVTYGVEEILIDKVYIPMYFNYKAAKEDGYTVVISGQGSDEVWLGYIFTWKIFQYVKEKYNRKLLIGDYYKNNMIFKNKINTNLEKQVDQVLDDYLKNNLIINSEDELNSYGDLSLKTILHDLLVQEDKIAMMSSVESRVPFVDNHKIVELAYKASSKIKTYDGREKYIVREYSKGKINDDIINREKYPFPEPPKVYNGLITKICRDNWEQIKNAKIIKKIINKELLVDVDNFTELEQWWLLTYWRFESIFSMEVL